MKIINLRELYPDYYTTDTFVEVSDEVLGAIRDSINRALNKLFDTIKNKFD